MWNLYLNHNTVSPKRYYDFLYKIIAHSLKIHDSDDKKTHQNRPMYMYIMFNIMCNDIVVCLGRIMITYLIIWNNHHM